MAENLKLESSSCQSVMPLQFLKTRRAYFVICAGAFITVFVWLNYVFVGLPARVTATSPPNSAAITVTPPPPPAPTENMQPPETNSTVSLQHQPTLSKPDGVRVIAVVFYGRRSRASLLECYLRKNLASHGGWLDEVIWAINTKNEDDLHYLEGILESSDNYHSVRPSKQNYQAVWDAACTEKDTVYVKIDDDVVFVDDKAIPRLVQARLDHPDALTISANVVNNPALGWLQYHIGAVKPYLPELQKPHPEALSTLNNRQWRASLLPEWHGPKNWTPPTLDHFSEAFSHLANGTGAPPGRIPKHRWLPLPEHANVSWTPISHSQYNAYGPNWQSWAICAQQHYSLLDHLEHDRLYKYYMVHGEDVGANSVWDMTGTRLSINFIAIWGRDIMANLEPIGTDDEQQLTVDLPLKLGKRECSQL